MVYALQALRRRPARTALTSLGIGLAVGLVVVLLSLSAGIQTSATSLAYSSGVDLIAASANATVTSGEFPPVAHAHDLALQIPAADPNVATASPWLLTDLVFGNASLWADANASRVPAGAGPTGSGTVGWIPSENGGLEVPPVVSGPGFTAPGDPHYANGTYSGPETHAIELDQALAAVLRVTVGMPVWAAAAAPPSNASLGAWYANATEFTVVGLCGPFWLVPSALLAFTYLSELQTIDGSANRSTDYASLVLIHLRSPSQPGKDAARIAGAFPTLSVFTLGDILSALEHAVDVYRTFGVLVGAIGLVVATLFTTTVLQMSVDDRSRELALLRALGFRRSRLGLWVLEEALVLSGIGLAIGLPLAYLAAIAINRFLLGLVGGLPTAFSFVAFPESVLGLGVAAVAAVGLAAGVAPAARAMTLPVAEELRAP